ncbi:biotin synthase, partial [Aliarcobacter butzleri]
MSDNKIYLCAISNIESGTCNEDCKFCTQSVKYKADIERYRRKEIEDIVNEAKKARANKAVGFCLVTAGTGLDDKRLDYVCRAADAVHKAVPDISLIACNGIASYEQLKELKKHGIENYNHNLETAREFYNEICTTHSWDDRYETCLNAKKAGLYLCTGGIFGLGETQENRISMLESIASLEPMSVPINFFHPNDALPLIKNPLTKQEAFDLVKLARSYLPNQMLMIAGGRELMFGEEQYDVFKHGANALVVGDY